MKHSALHIKQILITAISAIAISSSAYAVQPTTLTSNGVPFQALQTQIDNNADLIGENTAALTLLNTEISNINTQINNVDNALADLSLRVHDNTADINSAFGRIANNEDSVATLNDLVATHKIDVLSLQNALKQINVDILEINEQRQD
ncbi:MAG: hypothetical protein GQ582_04715, partial [Methyloprofundus sp.]|nr:hypothetical protein [Methyloprofundus sp.]